MKPHAFVAMPFGRKDCAGSVVDFNRIYTELFRPALEAAGLTVLRADEETRAGDIRSDMFQELLLADLVLADLTLDNPNVWYELGVRHALRARGVVLVSGGRAPIAFDLYTDRKLRYTLKDGAPDPETLANDRARLTAMVVATLESWHGRKISPVYQLLPNLQEPDWRSLRVGDVREFWQRHDAWAARVARACHARHLGDVLVLADEAPVAAFRAEAWIAAGAALRRIEHFNFALEQLERGMAIDPANLNGLREQGICLQRLAVAGAPGHSLERVRAHDRGVLERYPDDAETWALLGRVDKDAWVDGWRQAGATPAQMRADAAYDDALLRAAIDSYRHGYARDPAHYYSGVNALTLMQVFRDLTGDTRFDAALPTLAGAVRFAASNAGTTSDGDPGECYWALATLGDLEVALGTPDSVKAAYKEAIAVHRGDWFALNACREQLLLLRDLGFRPPQVEAGLAVFERALHKLAQPAAHWQPRRVFLFSGHLIDAPTRAVPRFPASKLDAAAAAIAAELEEHGAGADDLALTQGACGGDLLFTEACQQRGVRVHWLQPFDEAEFIERSVVCRDEDWRQRYFDARERLAAPIRSLPEELGAGADSDNAYERCNRWLLYSALACGIGRVRFLCLWNGGGGDGPGGTAHMYDEVKRRTGQVSWIDTRTL